MSCSTGKRPLGGGASGLARVSIYSSMPSANGWVVGVRNNSPEVAAITVYATCATV